MSIPLFVTIFVLSLTYSALSERGNHFDHHLPGSFCASGETTCCEGEDDSCSRLVHDANNATCFCDEFCDWKYGDCCPDFYDTCNIVTNSELRDLSQELLNMDSARLTGDDLVIDKQRKTKNRVEMEDRAPNPLVTSSNLEFEERPTVVAFKALLDNYNIEMGEPEEDTEEEDAEVDQFLDLAVETPLMQRLEAFLQEEGLLDGTTLKDTIKTLWFQPYSQNGDEIMDSSGFEHVFVGEHNSTLGITSGFHNWIRYVTEERAGNIDYQGYLKYYPNIAISVRFVFRGQTKRRGSILIGTSPEFDLALYTMCYVARPNNRCPIVIDDLRLYIQTWGSLYYPEKKILVTSYLGGNDRSP